MKLAAVACAVAALAVAGSAGAAAPRHVVETASSGTVTASFSYDYDLANSSFSNTHLTIARGGVTLLDTDIRPLANDALVQPANYGLHHKSVHALDLDGNGEPEVVLDLYLGGAHCCYYVQVYRYARGSYARTTKVWGNPSYRLLDLDGDGRPELVSGDDRFPYVFTDFADSAWPVRIWSYRSGRFNDVTRQFPAAVLRDGRHLWRHAAARIRRRDDVYGVLAAWTADRCLLGKGPGAFRELEALRRAGKLRGASLDETPRRYLRHLHRFLRRTGYCR
ncbi:MAG TPA: VCBS repeat-containing protein [Gaiellaceae bacterium]|jgi:hypothetical protein|nr:VCBS repeat-containing protein [Gaiellaceae bacterium]